MKVGEYVRTNDRGIRRIGKIIDDIFYIDEEDNLHQKGNLIKSSPNIMDLIQVGDYVNGEKITRIVPPDLCGDEELTDKKVYINDFEVYEEWIKSIVTKEQFSQMEYRIGE